MYTAVKNVENNDNLGTTVVPIYNAKRWGDGWENCQ